MNISNIDSLCRQILATLENYAPHDAFKVTKERLATIQGHFEENQKKADAATKLHQESYAAQQDLADRLRVALLELGGLRKVTANQKDYLDAYRKTIENLNFEIETLTAKVKDKAVLLTKCSETLCEVTKERDEYADTNKVLEADVKALRKERDDLKKSLDVSRGTNDIWEKTLDSRRKQMETLAKERDDLKASLQAHKDSIYIWEKVSGNQRAHIDALLKERDERAHAVRVLADDTRSLIKERDEARAAMEWQARETGERNDTIRALRAEVSELSKDCSSMTNARNLLMERVADLNKDLADLEDENKGLNKARFDMEVERDEMEAERDALQVEVAEMGEEQDSLKRSLEDSQRQRKLLHDRLDEVNSELAELNAKPLCDYKYAMQQHRTMAESVGLITTSRFLEQLHTLIRSLKSQLSTVQGERTDALAKLHGLRGTLKASEDQRNTLQQRLGTSNAALEKIAYIANDPASSSTFK